LLYIKEYKRSLLDLAGYAIKGNSKMGAACITYRSSGQNGKNSINGLALYG
jgi:hypothetical protein